MILAESMTMTRAARRRPQSLCETRRAGRVAPRLASVGPVVCGSCSVRRGAMARREPAGLWAQNDLAVAAPSNPDKNRASDGLPPATTAQHRPLKHVTVVVNHSLLHNPRWSGLHAMTMCESCFGGVWFSEAFSEMPFLCFLIA